MNNLLGKPNEKNPLSDKGLGSEVIPLTFNRYKYGLAKSIKLEFEKTFITNQLLHLRITSTLRLCIMCLRKTPYSYKLDYYYYWWRVCPKHMPEYVKSFINEITISR